MFTLAFFLLAIQWPPAPAGTIVSECKVSDSKVEGQPKVWLVRITLRAPDGTEQAYVLAHREAGEEKKALLDCYDFSQHYAKMAKKEFKK